MATEMRRVGWAEASGEDLLREDRRRATDLFQSARGPRLQEALEQYLSQVEGAAGEVYRSAMSSISRFQEIAQMCLPLRRNRSHGLD